MNLFQSDLKSMIQKAVKKDMPVLLKKIGNEKIYALALVTDSDCISLYLALNTEEYRKNADEKFIEMFQEDIPKEDIENCRNGKSSFTKWSPAEWGYSLSNSKLNDVSKYLYAKEEKDSKAYEKQKEVFYETVANALKALKDEKVFGKTTDEITYFVSASDAENLFEIENNSAKLINCESVYQAFLKRFEKVK